MEGDAERETSEGRGGGERERKAINGKAINRYANRKKSSDYIECIIG